MKVVNAVMAHGKFGTAINVWTGAWKLPIEKIVAVWINKDWKIEIVTEK